MARVLLIDLDGVLRRWPEREHDIERRYGLTDGALLRAAFDAQLLTAAITGRIDDPEWRDRVRSRLARSVGAARAASAVADWSRSPGELDMDVLAVVGASPFELALATNATSRLRADLIQLGVLHRFKYVVNSSEVGVAKPDREFFLAALRIVGATPQEALFVDDSSSNTEAATALGVRSHTFDGISELEAFLRDASP